jgi:N-acetylglucosamine kinase-like BadF-type ATPase
LTERLASYLGGEVQTKITELYQRGKTYIASCAPVVFQAAEEGDEVAMAILRRNARSLAELIEAAWGWLTRDGRITDTLPVVMGGSISVAKAPAWQNEILAALDPSVSVSMRVSTVSPVFGAVVEAIRQGKLEGEEVNISALRKAFADSYRKN